jgi:hypothetical protein
MSAPPSEAVTTYPRDVGRFGALARARTVLHDGIPFGVCTAFRSDVVIDTIAPARRPGRRPD